MARPTKNNADYFSHDNDMRNHRKVKAIRVKFGIAGYAIWTMFLEVLTGSEQNRWLDNEMELELLAGDFGVSVTEIRDVLDYCIKLELLHTENGAIYSKRLDDTLKSVYEKRERAKSSAKKSGKQDAPEPPKGVSVTETQQSKEKETKENSSTDVEEEKKEPSSPEKVDFDDLGDGEPKMHLELKTANDLKKAMSQPRAPAPNRMPPPSLDELAELLVDDREMREYLAKNYRISGPDYEECIQDFILEKKADHHAPSSASDGRSHFRRWAKYWTDNQKRFQGTQGKIEQSFNVTTRAGAALRELKQANSY